MAELLEELYVLNFPSQEDMAVLPEDYGELVSIDADIFGLAHRRAIDDVARKYYSQRLSYIKSRLPFGSEAYKYIDALYRVVNFDGYSASRLDARR